MDLLQYIRGGVKTTDFFDYNGYTLKLRPITSVEVDDAKGRTYKYVSPRVAKLIVQINLGLVKGTDKIKEIPSEMYTSIDKFNREFDYWVVYHSMKDFMPSDFTIEDVRKMQHIHKIAKRVLSISSSDDKTVIEIIKTEEGQEVAKLIWRYNVPLASNIGDITPLQHQFIIWSDPNAPISIDAVDDKLPEFGELIKNVRAGNEPN